MSKALLILFVMLAIVVPAATARTLSTADEGSKAPKYDPSRDPEKDLAAAVVEARRDGKRILLEVGGEWCIWCHAMDKFFDEHDDLTAYRDANYIMVKVNMSEENRNEAFLGKYPKVAGYPHIFVLDTNGSLLHSQDTALLEEGKSYNLGKFMAFLEKWAPEPVS